MPITIGSRFGSRERPCGGTGYRPDTGRSALTCEDVCAGTGYEGPVTALPCKKSKIIYNIEIYL